jgi:hypothetical protein
MVNRPRSFDYQEVEALLALAVPGHLATLGLRDARAGVCMDTEDPAPSGLVAVAGL